MRRIIPPERPAEPKPKRPPIDHVKALILERVSSCAAKGPDCARAMGVSLSTWYVRLRQPTDQWLLGELLGIAAYLGIEIDELRAAIRYERNRKHE